MTSAPNTDDEIRIRRESGALWVELEAPPLNLLTTPRVDALRDAHRRAIDDPEINAFVLRGVGRALTAGLDTGVLAEGGRAANTLLATMGRWLRELYASPVPVVTVSPGHAVAAGAMLLLASTRRIGAGGSHRIGFSEVRSGLPLPELPVVLARERLLATCVDRATLQGELFSPEAAQQAGFYDVVADAAELDGLASAAVADLAPHAAAYAESVRSVRGPALAAMDRLLDAQRARR